MSPWRVFLFSTLGMMTTGFAVYSLTPPGRGAAVTVAEPAEPAADELEEPAADAATETPQLAVGESAAATVERPRTPRPRATAAAATVVPPEPAQQPQFATPPPNAPNVQAEPVQAQVPQQQFATPPGALDAPAPGTLVAVAVGGTCEFLLNGRSVANGSTLKLQLAPGVYVVGCRRVAGVETRSVEVRSGATGMAMFRL